MIWNNRFYELSEIKEKAVCSTILLHKIIKEKNIPYITIGKKVYIPAQFMPAFMNCTIH